MHAHQVPEPSGTSGRRNSSREFPARAASSRHSSRTNAWRTAAARHIDSTAAPLEARTMFRRLAVLPTLLVLAACNWSECGDCITTGGKGPTIEGSGTMKTATRPVETFTAITLADIESSLLVIERTGEEKIG